MEPTPKQQAVTLIGRAQRILIVPGRPDGDSIGSAIGLFGLLKKINKEAAICVMDPISQAFTYLPDLGEVKVSLEGLQDLVITLSSPEAEPEKLSYNFQDGKLNIIITPKRGKYGAEHAVFTSGSLKYDLIVTLDAPDLSQLGTIFEQHPNIFKEIPVINIDHHASNSYFGTINLVDLTATSTAEILVSLAEAMQAEIDGEIATSLLTGIISDTGSFQHSNTTPKSLTVAAQLVAAGARQQEIIKHLFKTKPYSTLKLWGQVLNNLQYDARYRVVWATASLEEMTAAGAGPDSLGGLIDELMTSVPEADIVMLLSEREPKVISGSLRTAKGVNAMEVANLLGGGGHPAAAGFKLPDMTIEEATRLALEKIQGYLTPRMGEKTEAQPEKPAVEA